MTDRILDAFIKDFANEYSLTTLPTSELFERFVNYCIVSRLHPGEFDINSTCVGENGTVGIDGAAILVNEHLVTSTEEVDDCLKFLGRIDATFTFVQAKTSPKFDMGDISKFLHAVEQFFTQHPEINLTESVQNLREIQEHIYSHAAKMRSTPTCSLYYVSKGEWTADENIMSLVNATLSRLRHSNLFSDIKFIPVDASKLKGLYRSLKNQILKSITFDRHAYLPVIDGVEEAYLGILPCKEYLKLICDEDEVLQRSLFYDNVRDFQGDNPVNGEIADTLRIDANRDKFVLLNNGVTIVAKSVKKVGTNFTIGDYQVVNGCQTSHILYFNRNNLSDDVHIPVKLIITSDQDVTNKIIRATNRQTEVKPEAFVALDEFHKVLEEYYNSITLHPGLRLWYERRSKQYDGLSVSRKSIISITAQTKCFISTFLDEPHSTHRYYGELLRAYRDRMFRSDHRPAAYYASALGLYTIDSLIADGTLDRGLARFKYHILMLARHMVTGRNLPPLNSKKLDNTAETLQMTFADRSKNIHIFTEAGKLIESALTNGVMSPPDAVRRREFTEMLVESLHNNGQPKKNPTFTNIGAPRLRGVVNWFNDTRGYGIITGNDKQEYFIHFSEIRGFGRKTLKMLSQVEFTPVVREDSRKATNVISIDDVGSVVRT